MEEVIQFVIVIIFIGVALAFKLIEMATRKKMPLPLPEMPPSEEFFSEVEVQPEPKVEIKPIPQKPQPIPKIVIAPKAAPSLGLSIGELQRGIILAAILGPPKALSRRRLRMY